MCKMAMVIAMSFLGVCSKRGKQEEIWNRI